MADSVLTLRDYDNGVRPTWCPGCGDFAILTAIKRALLELGIPPHRAALISGIGCGSKLPDYTRANGFMTIHGRPLPVATGFKLANPEMHVLVVDGDGDAYGIGGNHFLHTLRRNVDLTHVVENNQIYALTKGQYSPTSEPGFRTTTSPEGAPERPVLPTALAFAGGATFVARGFAGDPKRLTRLIAEGIEHPGYALIDVLQPCVTFNRLNTYAWYQERIYHVEDEGHDPRDRETARRKVEEWEERIPVGLLWRQDGVPPYERQVPGLAAGPVVGRPLDDLSEERFRQMKEGFC